MLNFKEKTELAESLVAPLNALALEERAGKILCERIVPITHKDLMALSDAELQLLQEKVRAAQLAKGLNKKSSDYDAVMQAGRPKPYKIVCQTSKLDAFGN
jgi:hypothetical protein